MQVSLWELDEGSPGIGLSNWYVSFAWKNALWVDVWTERVSYATSHFTIILRTGASAMPSMRSRSINVDAGQVVYV
jgi:hypothetical protein